MQPLRHYVVDQLLSLLDGLAEQVSRATADSSAGAIHDMRVSIRKFTQGLLLFPEFFPESEVARVRKNLKEVMRLAAEVRNRDIALEYLAENAKERELMDASLIERLRQERASSWDNLKGITENWQERSFHHGWRATLALAKDA